MRSKLMGLLLIFAACNTTKKVNNNMEEKAQFVPQYTPGPQAMVYKTDEAYVHLVPIQLSDDKSEIVSYPHPNDVKVGSGYPLPTLLKNGYLLDNRGIGKNVAFIKWTYEEYAQLKEAPTLKELYDSIIDKDPLTELCNCGNKTAFTDIQKQINELISNNGLRTICQTIK